MTDGNHDSPLVVIDAPPLGLEPVVFEHGSGIDVLQSRHLETIVQIIYDVEDGIFVIKIYDFSVGKDFIDPRDEVVPLDGAVKIVHHQEAATQQIFAHLL